MESFIFPITVVKRDSMLNLTKKQMVAIVVASLIPLMLTAMVTYFTMRAVENDFSMLKDEYAQEISEEKREEARVNYLSERGMQLKSIRDVMLERIEGFPENYTRILGRSMSSVSGSSSFGGRYLISLQNYTGTLNVTDIYVCGEGEGTVEGAFELRGVISFQGNISARVEGTGYILEGGSPRAGEFSEDVLGQVEGHLGSSLWNLRGTSQDAFIMGNGELEIQGGFYGHISGDVILSGFDGYILVPELPSVTDAVDYTPQLVNIFELANALAESRILPPVELEFLLPRSGGIIPLNLTPTRCATFLSYLDEWNTSSSAGFIEPPAILYSASNLFILVNFTPPVRSPPLMLRLTYGQLSQYLKWNLPAGCELLSRDPVEYYVGRGYTPGRTLEMPENITCTQLNGTEGSVWLIYSESPMYGSYLLMEVPEEELEGFLPPPGRGFTGEVERIFESERGSLKRANLYIMAGIASSSALLVLVSYYAGKRLTEPLSHLIEGVGRVERRLRETEGEGRGWQVKIPPIRKDALLATGDEFESLVDGVNSMIDAINTAFLSLTRTAAEREEALKKLRRSYSALLKIARGLEKNEEAMNHFLANISHELRTPLHIMMGRLELLKRRGVEDQEKFLKVFSWNLKKLQLLLENLMAVSMIETGAMVLQRRVADLSVVTGEVVEIMRGEAERKGIEIVERYGGEVFCNMDVSRIQAAIRNIVDNAIKFSPENSRVLVEVRGGKDWGVVAVADSGPGIPARERRRVFRRFYQVDSSSRRREGGMGMGLYLVKNIVELHGGRVRLKSREGAGSRVEILLPRDFNEKDTDSGGHTGDK